jgi:hypothetical protein
MYSWGEQPVGRGFEQRPETAADAQQAEDAPQLRDAEAEIDDDEVGEAREID